VKGTVRERSAQGTAIVRSFACCERRTRSHDENALYEPGLDHPLLIPSAGDARPGWTLAAFKRAVGHARHGKVAVLQFHGVPDSAHDWVTTSREQFGEHLSFTSHPSFFSSRAPAWLTRRPPGPTWRLSRTTLFAPGLPSYSS
jgi:hypothetical protein